MREEVPQNGHNRFSELRHRGVTKFHAAVAAGLAHERTIAEMRVHDGRSSRRLPGGHELHSPGEQPKRLVWFLIDLAPSGTIQTDDTR